ncbi:MAG: hypothetical protein ACREFZ_12025 [Acetobacteraceae bacterium]
MTDSELANLLEDCLVAWGVSGRIAATDAGIAVRAGGTVCTIGRAADSAKRARWLLSVNDGPNARNPRRASSITILLSEVRSAIGADAPGPGFRVAETP